MSEKTTTTTTVSVRDKMGKEIRMRKREQKRIFQFPDMVNKNAYFYVKLSLCHFLNAYLMIIHFTLSKKHVASLIIFIMKF